MNVYDFDKTICRKDSSVQFFLWCLKRHPRIARRLPSMCGAGIRYLLKSIDKTAMKQSLFRFFADLPDPEEEISEFWLNNMKLINSWYFRFQRTDDVVVTASPEALVGCVCKKLGLSGVVGSRVNIHTGEFTGKNCSGPEKVSRFREAYPYTRIEHFYSDSIGDDPMACVAEQAFLVKGDSFRPWPTEDEY